MEPITLEQVSCLLAYFETILRNNLISILHTCCEALYTAHDTYYTNAALQKPLQA